MKIALLLAVLATLALTGVASAAAPPFGHLTGGASLATSIGITSIDVNSTVFDGELVFFARNNDKSNDCDGDTGSVDILYETLASATYNIACAHYTGSAFSFDYFDSALNTFIVVVVYRNDPSFEVYVGSTTNATLAMQWVNRGWAGSGARKLGLAFPEVESAGDYTITA